MNGLIMKINRQPLPELSDETVYFSPQWGEELKVRGENCLLLALGITRRRNLSRTVCPNRTKFAIAMKGNLG
jgi:hypothetical protein